MRAVVQRVSRARVSVACGGIKAVVVDERMTRSILLQR